MAERDPIEARLSALELTVRELVRAIELHGIKMPQENIQAAPAEEQETEKPSLPDSPFEDIPDWNLNPKTGNYVYSVSPSLCPAKGGRAHKTFKNGHKITKYKDIGGSVIRVKVQRWYCKECAKTFLQNIKGVHCYHRITLRLYNEIISSARNQVYGTKLLWGNIIRVANEVKLDTRTTSSVIYKYGFKSACPVDCQLIKHCKTFE